MESILSQVKLCCVGDEKGILSMIVMVKLLLVLIVLMVGILPMLLIALNNCQSANSNLQRQTNFAQSRVNVFLRMDEDETEIILWGERLKREVEETQDLEMVRMVNYSK